MFNNLFRELKKERRSKSCEPNIPKSHLLALENQLDLALKEVNHWLDNPNRILSDAVPELEQMTLLALQTPACSTNFKALVTGQSMALTFATCSYLGHPTEFDADNVGADDDCRISQEILDGILGSPIP